MAREDDILRLFATVDDQLGAITGLVNNAGITGPAGKLIDITAETVSSVMNLNVVGPFLCAREAARRMAKSRGGQGGVIVNVSSRAAALGSPNEFIHYAASKGAIDSFTIGLSKELAPEGIRVNAVNPGLIETEIHDASGIPGRLERLVSGVPQGRVGQGGRSGGSHSLAALGPVVLCRRSFRAGVGRALNRLVKRALRHPLHPALLGDLADLPADVRVGLQELLEIAGAQFQQGAVGQRHHIGPPGSAIDQGHLAKEIATAQADAAIRQHHLDSAGRDEIHGGTAVAGADEGLVRQRQPRPQHTGKPRQVFRRQRVEQRHLRDQGHLVQLQVQLGRRSASRWRASTPRRRSSNSS